MRLYQSNEYIIPTFSGILTARVFGFSPFGFMLRCFSVAVWRNWQTQQTQNLPGFTPREGSIPFTATIMTSENKEAYKYALGMVWFNFGTPALTLLVMWLFSRMFPRLWTWMFR